MRRAGLLAGALVLLAGTSTVQGCGGTGSDPAGLPAPDAVIRLLEQGTGAGAAVTSDSAADPRLRPHVYPLSPVQTAHAVVNAIDGHSRWEVVAGKDGVIWATRRTWLRRSVDDVYLLLMPAHDSTVIFARSASRAGDGDPERNARNLADLWDALGRAMAAGH